ncbi:15213_t:CDS:1 [Funneliformis geosporum]|nr:15213_t:CDS:1 [Funneliformis geosporum]
MSCKPKKEDPDSHEIYCLENYKYRHPNLKIKKISSLQIKEHYSKELRANFCQFLKIWLQEADSDEKLEISTSANYLEDQWTKFNDDPVIVRGSVKRIDP